MIRTSLTHPIRIDALPVLSGRLGLTFCPGKHGDSLTGTAWSRDLELDLAAMRDWGSGLIVTLMERHEFDLLRVPELSERIIAHGFDWVHLPIRDVDVPAAAFDALWPTARADILARLRAGGDVVLHCRGGLGRTGLVAAMILIETGVKPEAAILAVRSVRPSAIETTGQERYVRSYRASHPVAVQQTTRALPMAD